jgi:hypothetical protein
MIFVHPNYIKREGGSINCEYGKNLVIGIYMVD